MKPFRDNRRVLWLLGVAALIVGVLAWGVFGPGTEELPGSQAPGAQLPSMANVPGESAPHLEVQTPPAEP